MTTIRTLPDLEREPGDAGFSSRNLSYAGPPDAVIEYRLDNGPLDRYPDVVRALRAFLETGVRPSEIVWHDDSGA